jgi:hypothetical protein
MEKMALSKPTIGFFILFFIAWGATFAQKVPPPEEILGFKVGTDYHLATYEQAVEYLRSLEAVSSRLTLFEMGKTSMGKPMIYAAISSEENMAELDRFKEISKKLALARDLTDEEAHRLAAEGKAVVWIDVGIHASECAPAQAAIQLAYDLVVSEDQEARLIRENTILLLVFANPDGMRMLAEWYHPNVGTPYETSSMPWLYHLYAGHDNNRDSYMNNLAETRNITRVVNREWYPAILYDHHQTAPFPARIWIPPAAEPTNPNLHPLFIRGKNLVGSAMAYDFDRKGQEGAISRIVFDFIYPGYEDSFCDFFNVISIMTETAHYRYATPHFYTVNDFPSEYKDFTIGAFYPSPWHGGWWRLKDGMEYAITASKSVLHTAAVYRETFLYGKYQMGRDTIAKFEKEPPYAWIIPQDQQDPTNACRLIDNMIFAGIEVFEAEKSFVCDGVSHKKGTWVIPMNQPFARFVKAIFEEQNYPDLTRYPNLWQGIVRPQNLTDVFLPPYDIAGWTLPYQMGVKVLAAYSPLEASLDSIHKATLLEGKVAGKAGHAYLISSRTNNSFIAVNRILQKGGAVFRIQESIKIGDQSYPPGTFVVPSKDISKVFMGSLSEELNLPMRGIEKNLSTTSFPLKAPKVALYQSWTASSDEGWTRWLLEQYEFPFVNIHDAEVRAGSLKNRFDILIIPSMSTDAIVEGNEKGTMPSPYVGGITDTGVRNIKKFVTEGGTLVALNSACLFALEELDLPVIDTLKDLRSTRRRYDPEEAESRPMPPKFACPGSILRMEFDTKHPVAYGMPEKGPGMFYRSAAFDILPTFEEEPAVAIAKYPKGDLLMSGYLLGEKYLINKTAAADVPLGKGRVILLGFAVQNRAQTHGTFKLFFNSLFYSIMP